MSSSTNTEFHARILEGGSLSGLLLDARVHCKALLCASGGCGTCAVCRKVDAGGHPDILMLTNEDKSIAVEAVRNLRAQMWIRPNEGRVKIAVIGDAALLSPTCQNALLTLLEEPPVYGAVFLLCSSRMPLLPTVRSRCVVTQTGAAQAEAPPDETAKALWDALMRGSELLVLQAALRWEKLGKADLQAALDGLNVLFSERLRGIYSKEEQNMQNKRLTPAKILRMMDVTAFYRGGLAVNAGAGHLCGALAVDLFEVMDTEEF